MFGFFRSRKKSAFVRRQPPKRRRFGIEPLEGRQLPTATAVGLMAQTADAHNVSVNGQVEFSDTPSVCSIVLSGEVSATLSTDSSGNFDYYGPAAGLGTITAQATDSGGNQVEGSTSIMDSPPQFNSLDVQATGQGKQVEVTGSISAGDVSGPTVTFAGSIGLADSSTTTDSNGNFDLITTATSLGDLTATVTDVWGTQTQSSTSLMVPPPSLSQFTGVNEGNGIWCFSGTVSGPDLGDDTVQFSGVAAGATTVNADGTFSEELLLNGQSPSGEEYAVATDIWGQQSSQVVYMFF